MSQPHNPPPPPPPAQTPPPTAGQGPTAPTSAQPTKKGLPAIAWVGIGCGVLVLLGAVVMMIAFAWGANKVKQVAGDFENNPEMAAARLIIAANPEIELVEADDEAKTFTVRNTRTDEVFTVDLADVENGNFRFEKDGETTNIGFRGDESGEGGAFEVTDGDGNVQYRVGSGGDEQIPAWVPRYPGATIAGTMVSRSGGQVSGGFAFETEDSMDEVLEFYAGAYDDLGIEDPGRTEMSSGSDRVVLLNGSVDDRQLGVQVTREGGRTKIANQFSGPDGE